MDRDSFLAAMVEVQKAQGAKPAEPLCGAAARAVVVMQFPHQWALRWPVFILSGLLVVVICCLLTFQPSEVAAGIRYSIV